MLYYLARSAAKSRHCRLYVLLLFFYFLFSTICVTAIISKSTGLIFATFSGLAKLWLQMINLKFFFDTQGTFPWQIANSFLLVSIAGG